MPCNWKTGGLDAVQSGLQFRFDGLALLGGDGQDAVAQAAGPFGAGQHHAAHPEAEIAVAVLAATRPPGQRPAAHGVFDVVAAAAGHEQRLARAQQPFEHLHHRVVGQAQMRQRVARQRVQAQFQHDHVGPVKFQQRNHHAIERRQKRVVIGLGREGDVDVVSPARAFADFIFKAAPGEQRAAGLMQRNGHHVVAPVKGGLHAVAVMRVHVQVQNPFAGFGESPAGEHHVV